MLAKILMFPRRIAFVNFHRCISSSSLRNQSKEVVTSEAKFDKIKLPEKKPARGPLMKNIALARVDPELLGYPEAFIEAEVANEAKLNRDSYSDFLKTNVFVNSNDNKNIEKLKAFGSFTCQTALTTERLFSFTEPEAQKLSYGHFINNHKLVGDVINQHCNEQMKQKYLVKMTQGELIGTVCLTEKTPCHIENKPLNAQAIKKEDNWVINGEKSFILLHNLDSTVLLVAASAESSDFLGDYEEKIGWFIIDGNTPGVSIAETHDTIGYEEEPFKTVTLKFENVNLNFGIMKIYL